MLRVVVDTNVILSGILSSKGAPAEILDAWRERRFLLLISPAIIAEVLAVLNYPRIRKKYALSDSEIGQLISLVEHDALLLPGNPDVVGSVPDDPADEMFLACALDGGADMIVSGDHHLLDLEVFQDIPIMSARKFFEQINE